MIAATAPNPKNDTFDHTHTHIENERIISHFSYVKGTQSIHQTKAFCLAVHLRVLISNAFGHQKSHVHLCFSLNSDKWTIAELKCNCVNKLPDIIHFDCGGWIFFSHLMKFLEFSRTKCAKSLRSFYAYLDSRIWYVDEGNLQFSIWYEYIELVASKCGWLQNYEVIMKTKLKLTYLSLDLTWVSKVPGKKHRWNALNFMWKGHFPLITR